MPEPVNLPKVGDRVKARGKTLVGELVHLDAGTRWAHVKWDGEEGPRVCHLYELEKA